MLYGCNFCKSSLAKCPQSEALVTDLFEVRTGAYVCRIERITYAWAHVAGARHINIIIEGLNLLEVSSSPTRKTTRHGQRSLTLADLKNGCGMKHRCLFSP